MNSVRTFSYIEMSEISYKRCNMEFFFETFDTYLRRRQKKEIYSFFLRRKRKKTETEKRTPSLIIQHIHNARQTLRNLLHPRIHRMTHPRIHRQSTVKEITSGVQVRPQRPNEGHLPEDQSLYSVRS